MNSFSIVAKKGTFKNGRRYSILKKQFEFTPEIWDIIKEFLIDWDAFLTLERVSIPRAFIIHYSLNSIKKDTKREKDLVKVSNYYQLLSKFKTEAQAEQEDEDNGLGLEAYYYRQQGVFLIDYELNDDTYIPLYLPYWYNGVGGSSPMAYAVGGIVDNDNAIRKVKKQGLFSMVWKPMRRHFINKYEEAEQEQLKEEQRNERLKREQEEKKADQDRFELEYRNYNPTLDKLYAINDY